MHDLDGHFVVRHSIARTIAAGVAAGAAMNTVFRVLRAVGSLRRAARADGGRARVLGVHRLRRQVTVGKSPAWIKNGMKALSDVLPSAEPRTLEGQTHIVKAEALAQILVEFSRTKASYAKQTDENREARTL